MRLQRHFLLLLLSVAAPAWAQTSSPALNLKVPEDALPAETTADPAGNPAPERAGAPPTAPDAVPLQVYDVPYGMRRDAAAKGCDDKTYGQPQVHGGVSMGVGSGKHVSDNYQAAGIAVTKALGSCDDPKGLVGASISVEKDSGNRHRPGRP